MDEMNEKENSRLEELGAALTENPEGRGGTRRSEKEDRVGLADPKLCSPSLQDGPNNLF